MSECPVEIGDLLAEKYRVEEILGHGGMGVVVAARHVELDQRVAMKFLLPSLAENTEAAERFRREARAAVKIRSEYVARVIDVGTMDGGVPYMVMEFLDGQDLAAELQEVGALDVASAARFMLQACEAIAAAHAVGIVHRDLKPANLFLTRRADQTRCLKVLDFGISKSLQSESSGSHLSLTRTRAMVGSPLYMSPEQLESSRNVDERADIWSLGVIFYELVTGKVPFMGESLPQLVRAVLTADKESIVTLCPDLPPELDEIVNGCLQQDRENRLSSVAELASALASLAPEGPASAARARRILEAPEAHGSRVPRQSAKLTKPDLASAPKSKSLNSDSSSTVRSRGSEPPEQGGTQVSDPGTIASWGETKGDRKPKESRGLVAALAGLAAVAAAGGWWLLSPSSADSSAEANNGQTSAPAVGRQAAEGSASSAPNTEPSNRPTPIARHTATPLAATAGSAQPSATTPIAPAAPSASAVPEVAPAQPSAQGDAPRVAPKRSRPPRRRRNNPKPATKSNSGSGFTDFGGRR